MARRWPTQPLVLWHVPKKKPVVGSATECVPVDTAFDEAAYCDTHVEAARQLEFVEQLQWARNYVSLQRDIDDAPTIATREDARCARECDALERD